jgi:hypothetical protein
LYSDRIRITIIRTIVVLRYTKDDWADWNVTVETRMTFADKVREHFAVGCLGRRGGVGRLDPPAASEPVAAANDVSVVADDDVDNLGRP